ncbi:MAG: hypothetical protein RLZZ483_413 [Actinomycetota bacterium]|jgi:hypothetical protein
MVGSCRDPQFLSSAESLITAALVLRCVCALNPAVPIVAASIYKPTEIGTEKEI